MAASPSPWILNYLSTECYLFVGQHLDELIPRSIRYTFSEPMGFEHIFDIQFLDSNSGVPYGKASALLVQKVSPLVADFNMLFSQPKSCFPPVGRTFNFLTQSSLQELDSFFCFENVAGVN